MSDKKESLFRQEALTKISSPERLDQLIKVTLPRAWVALLGLLFMLVVILAWSFLGKLQTVSIAPGIIYPSTGGPTQISADEQGLITRFLVPQGASVEVGQPLIEVKSFNKTGDTNQTVYSNVIAPFSGTVIYFYADIGQYVNTSTPILLLEPMKPQNEKLRAFVFIAPKDGKWVKLGMNAEIALDQVDVARQGYIKGIVKYVSPYPNNELYLMHLLQNEYLTRKMSEQGAPFEAVVELTADASDPTGYQWTTQNHPKEAISPGSLCHARIIINEKAPVKFVLPSSN